jgi:predicted DNA-binding protein (MmcQ/YjbR family)
LGGRDQERLITRSFVAVDFSTVLAHCLAKPGAWQDEPWDDDVVAKVGEKIFAFLHENAIGVKCGNDRDEADEWLMRYPEDAKVMAYIGRSGWNVLRLSGDIPDSEILEAIDDSYSMVVSRMPRSRRPEGWEEA